MIDNTKARGLQEIFAAGRREALEPLAIECNNIAYQITKKFQRFSRERRAEIAHEASARLIERYLRNPDYRVKGFTNMLRIEVRHVVTGGGHANRPKAIAERTMLPIEDVHCAERQPRDDVQYYAEDIESEHPQGGRILRDIYRATTFRAAILALSEYVDRRWLYDHSVKLRTVYRMTRRK
jgi:signal transduction histidine kinase